MSPVLAALQQGGLDCQSRWGQGTQGSEQGDDKHPVLFPSWERRDTDDWKDH